MTKPKLLHQKALHISNKMWVYWQIMLFLQLILYSWNVCLMFLTIHSFYLKHFNKSIRHKKVRNHNDYGLFLSGDKQDRPLDCQSSTHPNWAIPPSVKKVFNCSTWCSFLSTSRYHISCILSTITKNTRATNT